MRGEQLDAPALDFVKQRIQYFLGQEEVITCKANLDPVVADGLGLAELLELLHCPVWQEVGVHLKGIELGNAVSRRVAEEGADTGR